MEYSIKYIGFIDSKDWPHHAWNLTINGEGFEYKTGVGHATPYRNKSGRSNKKPECRTLPNTERQEWVHVPNIDQILNCLFLDAQLGEESFFSFCENCGYSNDSLKALDMYRECMDAAGRLRRALGNEYKTERQRIENLEL